MGEDAAPAAVTPEVYARKRREKIVALIVGVAMLIALGVAMIVWGVVRRSTESHLVAVRGSIVGSLTDCDSDGVCHAEVVFTFAGEAHAQRVKVQKDNLGLDADHRLQLLVDPGTGHADNPIEDFDNTDIIVLEVLGALIIVGAGAIVIIAIRSIRRPPGYVAPPAGRVVTRMRIINAAMEPSNGGPWPRRVRIICVILLVIYFGGGILGWWPAHMPNG